MKGVWTVDLFQFVASFQRVAQHQPPFRGFDLKAFCVTQSVHARSSFYVPLNGIVLPTGELEPLDKPFCLFPVVHRELCPSAKNLRRCQNVDTGKWSENQAGIALSAA